MSYHNDVFPKKVSYGSRFGPSLKTNIVETESGAEQRVSRYSTPRRKANIAYGIKSYADLAEVQRFFIARDGAANAFPVEDPTDYHSNPTDPSFRSALGVQDQSIGTGDGTTKIFQLKKTYTSGPTARQRRITKPQPTTVKIWVNSVAKLEGTDFSVDYATGAITFVTAPTLGHAIDASFLFYVPMRFGATTDEWLAISADSFGDGSVDDIELIEVRDDGAGLAEEYHHGGSKEISSAITFAISSSIARVWFVQMTAAGMSVVLPDPLLEPEGSELFRILNGGANSFTVKDHLGVVLATVAAGQGVEVILSKNAAGKVWYAL